ncbi:uncharacterized protein LOC142764839 [Rhipicephalus microplus]|uniref:uncharacterized protein LOC142764839 n=1 Tax=Rhipicephalus microplus TaxID=6941 RepID=UPI003F6D050A
MQTVAMGSFTAVMVGMLLTAIVAKAEHDEQQTGDGSGETQETQNGIVDIANFYATRATILILGGITSQHPCMVDFVFNTSANDTYFSRYYLKGRSFSERDLKGDFTHIVEQSTYDAMTVTSIRTETRRQNIHPPWNTLEAIAYESSDGKCAIFNVKYLENGRRVRTGVQTRTRTSSQDVSVDYDFRLKYSAADVSQAQKCFEQLKKKSEAKQNGTPVKIPSTLSTCLQACKSDHTCSLSLSTTQTEQQE